MVHCSEMAIMMCKAALMNDSDSFEAMLAERYPQQAKKLGRCVYPFIEERWQSNILEIAVEVVYVGRKSPLATKNLLEGSDGLRRPPSLRRATQSISDLSMR